MDSLNLTRTSSPLMLFAMACQMLYAPLFADEWAGQKNLMETAEKTQMETELPQLALSQTILNFLLENDEASINMLLSEEISVVESLKQEKP